MSGLSTEELINSCFTEASAPLLSLYVCVGSRSSRAVIIILYAIHERKFNFSLSSFDAFFAMIYITSDASRFIRDIYLVLFYLFILVIIRKLVSSTDFTKFAEINHQSINDNLLPSI